MKTRSVRTRRLLAALAASAALALSGLYGPGGRASAPPPLTGCEGDACAQVTLTFDEEKGQYRAQNNSPDRWVRVTASNLAASASACLAPGKDAHLPLKSVVGAHSAAYAEPKCGAGAGT